MVALKPVPGVCRIAINGTLDGQPCTNVFHWRKSGVDNQFSQSQVDYLAGKFRDHYITWFMSRMSNKYMISEAVATDLTADSAPIGVATSSTLGAIAQIPLPANCAMVVSWKSTRRYRGGHARSYFGGLSQSDTINATTWSSTAVVNWQNVSQSFFTAVNALVITNEMAGFLCVVHRKQNKVDLDPPLVMPIIGRAVDTRIDSQRRRLGRDRPA
jgi:hypothetical protein